MLKILIVEDEATLFTTLKRLFIANNYEVIGYDSSCFTKNVKEANHVINNSKPDLVILDLKLDNDDSGMEIARICNFMQIPIVFLSAYINHKETKTTEIVKYKPIGAFEKPVNYIELMRLINDWFSTKDYKSIKKVGHKFSSNIMRTIDLSKVYSICKSGNYSIYTTGSEEFKERRNISIIINELPNYFIQINKGIIINYTYICHHTNEHITLENKKTYSIGSTFKKKITKFLNTKYKEYKNFIPE